MRKLIESFIYLLIFSCLLNCQTEQKLEGNYYICEDGYYSEVYFKRDSLRVASESEWVKLSEWRTLIMESDTIIFESFGEWRDTVSMKISENTQAKITVRNLYTGEIHVLNRIPERFSFEDTTKFWKEYALRKQAYGCN
ncbi:hypothetical protein POV27_02840 [Aureisphaera galaxeae]|uniref:hypothetical protein n=1 Tax=Aureisphaera galaxeae TaxID=1538023 RepID=UPI0023503DC5|nr:hypothetical protein [Aureisphaera galaxeae]MDC8002969.1 hypothetical protein [Aureisphaera galaxeae]